MFDSDKIWRCNCGTQHYLSITSVDDESYISLEGNFDAPTFRERLKAIWKILTRRGHFETWMEVLLTPETAREIADELLTHAAAKASEEESQEAEERLEAK
jgi:hypothetical protein